LRGLSDGAYNSEGFGAEPSDMPMPEHSVTETKQFAGTERRRNPLVHSSPRASEEVAVFHELGKALTSSLQLDQVLRTIMEKLDEFLQPDTWSLLLMDQAKQELYFELAIGKNAQALKDMRIKVGEGIAGWVAQTQQAVIVADVSTDTRFLAQMDEKTKTETRSIVAVPVRFRNTCLGVIELINCVGVEGFNDRDLALLEALADFAAIALENARHVQKIQELTITDDLTKLYNSRFLHSRLDYEVERARRFNYEISMIFLDLDYFKEVNDVHGHLSGSKLLREVAGLLASMLRTVDMACRYGGDEFIILMPGTSKKNAALVAEKLRASIKEKAFLADEGINIRLTASFGVASFPQDANSKEELIHKADHAMYDAKNRTRDSTTMMPMRPP